MQAAGDGDKRAGEPPRIAFQPLPKEAALTVQQCQAGMDLLGFDFFGRVVQFQIVFFGRVCEMGDKEDQASDSDRVAKRPRHLCSCVRMRAWRATRTRMAAHDCRPAAPTLLPRWLAMSGWARAR